MRCGWIAAGDIAGVESFVSHAEWFDVIHPHWWKLGPDGETLIETRRANDASVIAAARNHGVRIMPLVYVDDLAALRAILVSPTRRAEHIAQLVRIAEERDYDGYEIDYEKLWQGSDRPGLSALLTDLSAALHARGMELSMAIPSLDLSVANNGYDYDVLSRVVDRIHLMGYDFHYLAGTHTGPIAPLGWLRGVIEHVKETGRPEVFALGIANFGVGDGRAYTAGDAARRCGGGYATTTTHMASCNYGHYDAGRAPHCAIDGAMIYFEDLGSYEEKIRLAKSAGLGGIAYYSLGGEPPGLLELVERYY